MSKAGNQYRCDYCNLAVTGPLQYEQHISGQKHIRKLKMLGIEASVRPTTTSKGGVPVQGYAGKFVKSAGTAGTEDTEQSQKGQFGLDITSTTSSPTAHKTTVSQAYLPPPPPPPSLPTSVSECNDPVMKAIKANLHGKLPTKRTLPVYEGKCDLCDVTFSSKMQEDQHLVGKKHAKKTKLSDGTHPSSSATFYCGFCNVQSNSISQMKQHETGQNHLKKVQLARVMQAGGITDAGPSPAKKKFVPNMSSVTVDIK